MEKYIHKILLKPLWCVCEGGEIEGVSGALYMWLCLGARWVGAWKGHPIGSLCCSDNILNIPMCKLENLK